ncbi:hypothetical protein COCVIDRAFT_108226 [Bipolaris victoriae FI3]|uniref:Xylanolytic transcriptional activator regulatory domain-containing protein n=1 Tax=Bipolaris victoriae (strain FI3) TaxID=930091 RepID=W7EHB1_BIPV3|nr:hypothetical protein COCVIDRAFT_108226 [Bipolaris victoriae FI3]
MPVWKLQLPNSGIRGLQDFYESQRRSSRAPFVHDRIFHAFIDLYFEHFDPQFPFLHPHRLNVDEVPWILLLAVAAVGSHYSEMTDAQRYNLTLVDLLCRAVESKVSKDVLQTDLVVIQSIMLLHILLMFSGSYRERVILQHKRSMLINLCWDLLSKARPQRRVAIDNPDIEAEWQSWLSREEEIRLLTCVRVIECLCSLSLEIPTNFNLRDATRQLPSPEDLWRCKDAQSWKHAYQTLPASYAEQKRTSSPEHWPRTMLRSDAFTCRAALLELLIDEATVARQLYSSRLFRSSVASYLQIPNTGMGHGTSSPPLADFEFMRGDNTLLDTSVDLLSYATLEGSSIGPHHQIETIFHVLAILRRVSLEILNTATGWKTTKENMHRARRKFVDFCQQNTVQARRCLWHATCIFKKTRSSRKLACYDVYSILICTTYIYCYCSFFISETSASRQTTLMSQRRASEKDSPPTVVRLDQLRDRSSIERWIQSAEEHHLIHLTGVGLLKGSDDAVRFLRDIERTLESQIAWRGICCAFATTFAQVRRGEMPTESQEDNPEEDGTSS